MNPALKILVLNAPKVKEAMAAVEMRRGEHETAIVKLAEAICAEYEARTMPVVEVVHGDDQPVVMPIPEPETSIKRDSGFIGR
jgi:hypothetical protein